MKLFKVPLPGSVSGVSFEYGGETYSISIPRYVEVAGAKRFMFDLSWGDNKLLGIDIIEGVNLVRQYVHCPIQGMFLKKKVDNLSLDNNLGDIYDMYLVEVPV